MISIPWLILIGAMIAIALGLVAAIMALPNNKIDIEIIRLAGATYIQLPGEPVRKVLDYEASDKEVQALAKVARETMLESIRELKGGKK